MKKGETVTIIPGLDLGLVVKSLNEDELKILWGHFYMMYISSVNMIAEINNHKKEGKIWEILPKLRDKVIKSGLIIGKDKKSFNPFIGLYQMQETGEYDVNKMFTNVEELKTGQSAGMTMEDIFKMTGVDKLVDVGQLNDQLKNCKQEDIDDATENITKLLGAEKDGDVKDVCHTLVTEIVSDLKTNGLTSMFDTAKSVSQRVGKTMDKNKMRKTANQLNEFMSHGEEKLKGLKNEKGENIGSKIFDSLKIPLQLAQSMGSNSTNPEQMPNMPNLSSIGNLMGMLNGNNNQNNNSDRSVNKKTKGK